MPPSENVTMAGRVSVILRDQFEAAKRSAERHGTISGVHGVREQVLLGLNIAKEHLRPIDKAAADNDVMWLVRTFPDWNAERLRLRDEVRELERLLDHLDLFLNAMS
jgi:predicted TIM-barrel fold metal-dependent hydrolase